jgi:CRP-like cAMP-binding protein
MIDKLLHRLSRYGPPSEEEAAALAAIMTAPRMIPAGVEMIRQFSKPTESTLLLSGMVGRVVLLQGGARQITAIQVPGDFVDLHGFLLSRLDHSVTALGPCTIITAPHAELRRLTDRYPRLGRALWFLTLVDASIHRHWLTVIGRRDAVGGAAHLLCELYVRLDDVGLVRDGAFSLPLTQAEVADVLSLSSVHVNRVIQDLRSLGLVKWDRRSVQVLDWARLRETAEFEPTYLQLEYQIET